MAESEAGLAEPVTDAVVLGIGVAMRGTSGTLGEPDGMFSFSQWRSTRRDELGTFRNLMPTRPAESCQTISPERRINELWPGKAN